MRLERRTQVGAQDRHVGGHRVSGETSSERWSCLRTRSSTPGYETDIIDSGHGFLGRGHRTGSRTGDDVEVTKRAQPWRADRSLGHVLRRFREPREGRPARLSVAPVLDPVCGIAWIQEAARARRAAAHGDHVFFFCSNSCSSSSSPNRRAREAERREDLRSNTSSTSRSEQVPGPTAGRRRRARQRASAANMPLDALPDLGDTQVIVYWRSIAAPTSSNARSRIQSYGAARRARVLRSTASPIWLLVRLRDLRRRHDTCSGTLADANVPARRAVGLPSDARPSSGLTPLDFDCRSSPARRPLRRHSLAISVVPRISSLRYYLKVVAGHLGGGVARRLRPAVSVNIDPNRLRRSGL